MRGISMQSDKSTPLSRRHLVKLGAAAGTVALGAVGLPTVAIAAGPPTFRPGARPGAATNRSRPRAITNNVFEEVVGVSDWQGINGFLSFSNANQGVYCAGGVVTAPLNVPPGGRFAGPVVVDQRPAGDQILWIPLPPHVTLLGVDQSAKGHAARNPHPLDVRRQARVLLPCGW